MAKPDIAYEFIVPIVQLVQCLLDDNSLLTPTQLLVVLFSINVGRTPSVLAYWNWFTGFFQQIHWFLWTLPVPSPTHRTHGDTDSPVKTSLSEVALPTVA